jgi:hypothetical protein
MRSYWAFQASEFDLRLRCNIDDLTSALAPLPNPPREGEGTNRSDNERFRSLANQQRRAD